MRDFGNKMQSAVQRAWRAVVANRGLLGLLLLALLLRLTLWLQPLHELANDEVEYVTVARDLLAGRGWEFYASYHWLRAPLYPLFLAGSLWLAGGDLYWAALPNIVLSVATVYLIYRLALELLPNQRVARLAGLLAAILFTFATFASLYMSETLFSFLFTAALLLLLQWQKTAEQTPSASGVVPVLLRYWRVALAGLCFGLAALTRSAPMAFLPLVLLWIWLATPGSLSLRTWIVRPASWLPPLLFALCVALPIAPWTLRNCQAYSECILIETGLSYNLWAFSEPREDMQTIFRVLEQIPDPAERADEATRRGMERLREDPAILARKLWPNWIYLWRVKPIQDRFILASYFADPPPVVFLSALLFDDLLYLAILAAAVIGLNRVLMGRVAVRRSAALLLALWPLCFVAVTLLTHGEARYRHFIFPVMLSFAALAFAPAAAGQALASGVQRWGLPIASGALLLVLLGTVLNFYPWGWAGTGAARSWQRLQGDLAAARGDLARAVGAYQAALEVQATPDGWLALGRVYRQQGDLERAEFAYRTAWRQELAYVAASATLGDLLRIKGRDAEARTAFIGRYAAEQDVIDWSWTNLAPPPVTQIDVGNGLDFGYVGGFYPAEEQQGSQARWTNGRGRLRLALPPNQERLLRLRLAAPHPSDQPVPAQLCAANQCVSLLVSRTWRIISVQVPLAANVDWLELRSPTFQAPDGRQLGLLVDWVGQ